MISTTSFLLLVFLNNSVFAQLNVDSLQQLIGDKAKSDTVRLNAYNSLAGDIYMRSNPDSCLHYAKKYEKFASDKRNSKHLANALHLQGIAHYFMADPGKALKALQKSLDARGKKGEERGRASTLNVMGAVYMQQGNHAQAMIHYMACLRASEALKDSRGISGASHNIGRIYSHQNEYAKALEYFQKSLKFRGDDNRGLADELDVIGFTYADLNQDSLALNHFNQALAIRTDIGDPIGLGMSFNNIGQFYLKKKNLDLAMDYFGKALNEFKDVKDREGLALSHINLSKGHQIQNGHNDAISNGIIALELSKELGDARIMKESALALTTSYRAIGNSGKALEMYELYITMRDSIDSEENQREILNQEYKYQYETEALTDSLNFMKKEEVMQEKAAKQQVGLVAAGCVLVLLIGLAFSIYSGKKKSDELLLNILPYETAKELKAKGSADAQLIDQVTVLFTDFKGFTQLSVQVTPKELVRDLHECFSAFDNICAKHGIEKIKTIGDAYMAAGGLPTPNTTHATDTVKAALEMAAFVAQGKADKMARGLPFFEVRIGIHTGPVVAGIVGVKKFQYDIWGDTVNTASRMESSGEVGKVNISESTYLLVKHDFECTFRGEIEAKGKGKMGMWFVEKKSDRTNPIASS